MITVFCPWSASPALEASSPDFLPTQPLPHPQLQSLDTSFLHKSLKITCHFLSFPLIHQQFLVCNNTPVMSHQLQDMFQVTCYHNKQFVNDFHFWGSYSGFRDFPMTTHFCLICIPGYIHEREKHVGDSAAKAGITHTIAYSMMSSHMECANISSPLYNSRKVLKTWIAFALLFPKVLQSSGVSYLAQDWFTGEGTTQPSLCGLLQL